ncbi:MAG: sigma-70 family RNA polymerase sigma factor [Gemmataceae bacterium]|nr:sigma-70 family RNA polymerase sigma factor [Gemmataceae bacterium]
MHADRTTVQIERCLDRLRQGDAAARRELLDRACHRLRQLVRTMLADFPDLRRWEGSDDVLQEALLRLCRALDEVAPASARDFFRLAAHHIRWELLDLARHYFGPHGPAAGRRPDDAGVGQALAAAAAPSSCEPERLEMWTAFHEQVAALPDEERAIVDLLWYQGLTQAEAAAVLEISERTLKRRWQAARLRLHAALHETLPLET